MIDSGAVSDWNVGCSPDARALNCLRKHGIQTAHKAQQVEKSVLCCLAEVMEMHFAFIIVWCPEFDV